MFNCRLYALLQSDYPMSKDTVTMETEIMAEFSYSNDIDFSHSQTLLYFRLQLKIHNAVILIWLIQIKY